MLSTGKGQPGESEPKVSVSLVLAAFNEEAVVGTSLATLCEYMESLDQYTWEIVLVNDGSTDRTGALAEEFSRSRSNVRVLHHPTNLGLGHALRSAFAHCNGDCVVVLDIDLSYGPEHIPALITKMRETGAAIVSASPYREGGRISNVSWHRKILTIWSNRFLSAVAKAKLSAVTPMAKAYDRKFLRSLDLRAAGMDINLEIIYKAVLLQAVIEEIPAHLNWELQQALGSTRQSKMRILRQVFAVLLSGFLFRPVVFFIFPAVLLFLVSAYAGFWAGMRVLQKYKLAQPGEWFLDRFDSAVAGAYLEAPHAFILGALALLLAIQLLSLGVLSLQSTNYFQEMYHLSTTILKRSNRADR